MAYICVFKEQSEASLQKQRRHCRCSFVAFILSDAPPKDRVNKEQSNQSYNDLLIKQIIEFENCLEMEILPRLSAAHL